MFYTLNEKMDMWSCFIESGKNKRKAALLYSQRFGLERQVPNSCIFLRLEKNLKSNGSFNKQKKRPLTKTTEEYSEIVLQAFEENPNTSLRLLSKQIGISYSSVQRIAKKNKYYPYKRRTVQHLRFDDCERRLVWVAKIWKMFSLSKLAYCACDDEEREFYDDLETIKIDIQDCCIDLLNFLKNETKSNIMYDNIDSNYYEYSMIEKASASGHLECLAFAESRGFPWTRTICVQAAANGQLECLKYAHERGCPWDVLVCEYAAANGHLECLRYAREQGCPWDLYVCEKAARNGQLECLAYLHDNGCPWDESTCEAAAAGGHIDVLRYAYNHGCPWDSATCREAAANGHLTCLVYAHENGCLWDCTTCEEAAAGGHLHCLMYAHNNGCLWDMSTCDEAASNGHSQCLEYALKNGCEWDGRIPW